MTESISVRELSECEEGLNLKLLIACGLDDALIYKRIASPAVKLSRLQIHHNQSSSLQKLV
jgi:hypothetical protein